MVIQLQYKGVEPLLNPRGVPRVVLTLLSAAPVTLLPVDRGVNGGGCGSANASPPGV